MYFVYKSEASERKRESQQHAWMKERESLSSSIKTSSASATDRRKGCCGEAALVCTPGRLEIKTNHPTKTANSRCYASGRTVAVPCFALLRVVFGLRVAAFAPHDLPTNATPPADARGHTTRSMIPGGQPNPHPSHTHSPATLPPHPTGRAKRDARSLGAPRVVVMPPV